MTVSQLLKYMSEELAAAGVENSANEARWMLESVDGMSRNYIALNRSAELAGKTADMALELARRRCTGEPLQYILGEWDFCGETFFVGEGVLIPRPETQLLVDFACEYLSHFPGTPVIDLCAGSGCIGLSVARLNPLSQVCLVEKSQQAFGYLQKNAARFNLPNVSLIMGDVFDGVDAFEVPHGALVLSNPPYIPHGELGSLSTTVRREPSMALDGGNDGLDFYRAICARWLADMSGAVGVECAENQAGDIKELFSRHCTDISVIKDFNDYERCVTAVLKGRN